MTDNESVDKKFQKELNSGMIALVLLRVLDGSPSPMYGYQVAKMIGSERAGSDIKQGVLYPVLRSLEEQGLLLSQVEPSVSGPPRRYYQITPAGRETLQRWVTIWNESRLFVETILKGKRHE